MYGKHFASMYSGSMFGQTATVFAVWGYVIAHMRPSRKDGRCYIELNPALLAATFASDLLSIDEAIRTLEAPDPKSRTKDQDGRRLVLLEDERHNGPMQFLVVNGAKYRQMRDEEERRSYLRDAKRSARRMSTKSTKSTLVNRGQPRSTQVEVEVEADTNNKQQTCPAPVGASSPKGDHSAGVLRIFDHWRQRLSPKAKLSPKRKRLILARLGDGYSPDDLCRAVDGCAVSPWHNGENSTGTKYHELTLILRDAEHVDAFMEKAPAPAAPAKPKTSWEALGISEDEWRRQRASMGAQ